MEKETVKKIDALAEQATILIMEYQKNLDFLSEQMQNQLTEIAMMQQDLLGQFVDKDVRNEFAELRNNYIKDIGILKQQVSEQANELNAVLAASRSKAYQFISKSWLATVINTVVSAIVLICAVWLVFNYKDKIQAAKKEMQVLERIQKSDIIQCGEMLCARVDKNRQQQDYYVIKQK